MTPVRTDERRNKAAGGEPLATLFLTAGVYAGCLVLVVVGAGQPSPLLPRQMLLAGVLTMGLPAVYLVPRQATLGARHAGQMTPLAVPGFVSRALRFAVPAGAVTAAASYTAYTLTSDAAGGNRTEARTVATTTAFLLALWVTAALTGPPSRARRTLLACMVAAFALLMAVPATREMFGFELGSSLAMVSAAGVAVVASVALELGLQISGVKRS